MSSAIPDARKELQAALFLIDHNAKPCDVRRRVADALDMMTRTVTKKRVDLGNKMTPEKRSQIVVILESGRELADVEISEEVFGNGGGAGRVSEIRAGLK